MREVKTPEEFFKKILPVKFNREKAKGVDVIVNINISGINGGEWTVSIKNQKLKVENGIDKTPTLSLKISEKDYLDIINGKLSGTMVVRFTI